MLYQSGLVFKNTICNFTNKKGKKKVAISATPPALTYASSDPILNVR